MKKIKSFLIAIIMVISLEKLFQTIRGLKVVSAIDDESKTIGIGKPPKRKKARSINFMFGGLRITYIGRNRSGKMIILMSASNPNPVITATISAPDAAEGKAKIAESIRDKGASTLYVTIDPEKLAELTPLIKNLRDAVGVAEVDYAWNELNAKLKLLMRIIQDKMDELKPQSLIICVHYGYHAKGRGGKSAQIFGGEPGAIVGSIDLVFPVGPQGCCYGVKFWNAARTTFTYAQPTDIAHGHFDGLVSGEMQNVSVVEVAHGVFVRESQIIAVRAK